MSGPIDGGNRNANIAGNDLHISRFSVGRGDTKETVLVVTVDPYKHDSVRHAGGDDRKAVAELLDALKNGGDAGHNRNTSGVFDDILGDQDGARGGRRANNQDTVLARALLKVLGNDDDNSARGKKNDGMSERDLLALILLAKALKSPKDQNLLLKAVISLEAGQNGRRGNDMDKMLGALLGGAEGGRKRGGCDDVEDLSRLLEVVANSPELSNKIRAKLEAVIIQAMVKKLEKLRGPQAEYALLKVAGSLPNLPPQIQKIVETLLVAAIIKTAQRDHNLVNLAMLAATVSMLGSDAKQKLVPVVLDGCRGELKTSPQNAQSLTSIARSMGVSESQSPELSQFLRDLKGRSKEQELAPRVSGSHDKTTLESDKSKVISDTAGDGAGSAGNSLRNAFSSSLASASAIDATGKSTADARELLKKSGDVNGDGTIDDADRRKTAKASPMGAFTFDDDADKDGSTSFGASVSALGGANGRGQGVHNILAAISDAGDSSAKPSDTLTASA